MNETVYIKKIKHDNFTTVDNGFVRNNRLSWKAKGILLYLVSLPDNWVLNQTELKKHSTDGVSSLRAGLTELKENGYLNISKIRDDKGQFVGTKYEVDEYGLLTPVLENPKCEKPKCENPISDNRTLLNTDNTKDLNILNTNIPSPTEVEEAAKEFAEVVEKPKTKRSPTKKVNEYTALQPKEYYEPILKKYNQVFFSLKNGGLPNSKDYKKRVDGVIQRLQPMGFTPEQIQQKILEAIGNAPKLPYWVNETKGSLIYILSETGLSKLTGTSVNTNTKGSAYAQVGQGNYNENSWGN